MEAVRGQGLRIYAELRGEEAAEQMASTLNSESDSFSKPVSDLATCFAFGSVWSREGLERRERSLITMSALVALRQPEELRKHIQIGLRNGLSVLEIRETLVQLVPYVGFPAVASAIEVAMKALKEAGIDPNCLHKE
ncbi:carboxymuconolactone decarboxylase family protein [Sphingobium sp.]|uniref:carboxymuconolactone decarboxylase family protein n=1 Tax=Sphingobium sp. TaxID=1912891 RepID=UPI0028BE2C4F|nr:carboxymuconolactone decarboxylase family protein [Sphingobium sp.]